MPPVDAFDVIDLLGILTGKPLVAAVFAAGEGLFDGLVLVVGTVTLLVTALTEEVVISLVVLILMGVVVAIASVNKIYM